MSITEHVQLFVMIWDLVDGLTNKLKCKYVYKFWWMVRIVSFPNAFAVDNASDVVAMYIHTEKILIFYLLLQNHWCSIRFRKQFSYDTHIRLTEYMSTLEWVLVGHPFQYKTKNIWSTHSVYMEYHENARYRFYF